MERKRSFIMRLFTTLFALLLAILTVAGFGIYVYARQVVGEEFIRLNQANLQQVASNTGSALMEALTLGKQIAVNSRLLALSELPQEEARKEAQSILNDLVTEYNATHTNNRSLMDVFVLGFEGLHVSAYNSETVSAEELFADPLCAPLLAGEKELVLLPTQYNEGGAGVMRYTFQIVFPMEDLFTAEQKGLVVLDLSELNLYSQYQSFDQSGVYMAVISRDGSILSSQEKQLIGMDYGYDVQRLIEIARYAQVSRRVREGEFQLCERIPGTDWFLVERIPEEVAFEPLTQVRNVILAIIVACGALALGVLVLTARRLLRRVARINGKMEQVIEGDLTVRIPVERNDEFGLIEHEFNAMVEEIARLIEQVRKGEQQKRLAELDFLQAEINPHFIHNTLTSIRFMLEMGKNQEAGEMIFYFSRLLRQSLSRSDEFIALREELDTLESYVNLQKFRYKDTFEVSYDLASDTLTAKVPALILQPIVENAIFHGAGRELIHILISSRREEDDLILRVEDDGVGMPRELQETVLQKDVQINRVGLRNVHDRLQLNYGKEFGLSVSDREGHGTVITFRLPFNRGQKTGEGET